MRPRDAGRYVLTDDLAPRFDDAALALPPLFEWLKASGGLSDAEMRRTFNCGVGMIAVVAEEHVDAALESLAASGERAWRIGRMTAGSGKVQYV